MRVIILLASIALAHSAKLGNTYLPPTNALTAGASSFLQTPLPGNYPNQRGIAQFGHNGKDQGIPQIGQYDFAQSGNGFAQPGNVNYFAQARQERPRAALERNAAILRQDSQNDGESFAYAYETENGIYAEESGVATNGVEAQGGYSYTGDDGQVYSVRYTADQNGFVPQGDHLPTPPPVPEEILKALEQNARDEAAGIYDDGSYNDRKYADNAYNAQYNYPAQPISAFNGNDEDTVVTDAFRTSPGALTGASFNGPFNGNPAYPRNPAISRNVEKAYLPPFRGQVRNGGRRPSFNSRTGYNY